MSSSSASKIPDLDGSPPLIRSSSSPTPALAHDDDTAVPLYTETSTTIPSQLDGLDATALGLPLTHHPGDPRPPSDTEAYQTWQTQDNLIRTFFSAIASKNTELVTLLVQRGILSPNCLAHTGATPLIAAVDAGNAAMARCLVSLGADVDGYGAWWDPARPPDGTPRRRRRQRAERTPLQVAAAKGNLVLVKLLIEGCGADDGVVAPDGQLALRLAAEAGHREVVAYLPMRRGGELRRWKAHHAVAMRRAREAWESVGRLLGWIFWRIPKGIVKYLIYVPIKESVLYCVRNRHRFGGWCKRQVEAFPGRAKRAAKATWRGIKKIPKACKEVGEFVWEVTKWLGKLIKNTPAAIWKAIKMIGIWLWAVTKKLGSVVWHIVKQFVSVVHTLISAIVTFFREITIQDVWNAFCALTRTTFISLPKAIWHGIAAVGKVSYDVLEAVFGWLGKAAWFIVRGVYELVLYIPEKLGIVVGRMASSVKKGGHEVLVWWDPKRV